MANYVNNRIVVGGKEIKFTVNGLTAGANVTVDKASKVHHKEESFNVDIIVATSSCPVPMTRAALIALRTASGLSKDCDYVITDHTQGTIGAGTLIHLQAVSANALSENVQVKTTFDNEAWRGIYNLDTGLIIELQDNLNNIARGITGSEVAAFNWGNTAYTNCLVDSSTWAVTIGSVRPMNNVKVIESSFLDTTTMGVGGQISNALIKSNSTVNLTNNICNWRNLEVSGISTVTAINFTGTSGVVQEAVRVHGGSVLNLQGTTSPITLTRVVVDNQSLLSLPNITTGSTTITNVKIDLQGQIGKNNGAAASTITHTEVLSGGIIRHDNGVLNVTGTRVDSDGLIRKLTTVGGAITVINSYVGKNSVIENFSVGTMTITRCDLKAFATIDMQAGAAGAVTCTDCELMGANSLIRKLAASTAGTLSVTQGSIVKSGSSIQTAGTGNITIAQVTCFEVAIIGVLSGNRNYSISNTTITERGEVRLSGTGAVTDVILDCSIGRRGLVTFSANGIAANSLNQSHCFGLNGAITISGTTSGKVMNTFKVFDGQINISNDTSVGGAMQLFTANDNSQINFTGNATTKIFSALEASNNSSIVVLAPTGVGAVNRVKATNGGQVTIFGPAGVVTNIMADQGVIGINGGNQSGLSKKMSGTLTTGNFNHTDIYHHFGASQTLTASNTNRGRDVFNNNLV